MNYENFVFYGSWRETLEGMAEDFGIDYAREALWNIMTCATCGDIETDKKFIISFISGAVMPNINKAKDRYAAAVANGKKGGRKPIELNELEVMDKKAELKTWKAVAAHYGIDEDTLRKIRKGWEEKTEKPKNLDKDIDIDKDIDTAMDWDSLTGEPANNATAAIPAELTPLLASLNFSGEHSIRQLLNEGKTPQWILAAFNSKGAAHFNKVGTLGLLFDASFRSQIDSELAATAAAKAAIDAAAEEYKPLPAEVIRIKKQPKAAPTPLYDLSTFGAC